MAARPAAPTPAPSGRQLRNPISRRQVERVLSRSVAVFGIVFSAQGVGALLGQLDEPYDWWLWAVVPALVAALIFATVMSFVGRFVRPAHGLVAAVYILALISWPFAVQPGADINDGPHWLYQLLTVATACAAIALNTIGGTVYLLAVPSLYFIGRIMPSGGGVTWQLALLESVYSIILGAAVMIIVTMLRQASASVDIAQATALERYGNAVREHALEVERVQVDAIVHDSVLTTLLSAARAETPEAKELAARMAGAAIGHLRDAALVSPDDTSTVPVQQLLRELGDEVRGMPMFEWRARPAWDEALPAPAAEVIHAAAVQAMVNSLQHAGEDARRWVAVGPAEPNGVVVTVGDTGVGFDPTAGSERLGVRVSIIERMANAGGVATIDSQPGVGTVVTLRWPDEDARPALDALSGELGLQEPEVRA